MLKKKLTVFIILGAFCLPTSFASASMLNATPSEITGTIMNEIILLKSMVSDEGIVAGASTQTNTGLVIKVDGKRYLQLQTATQFNVAKELCYIMASGFLATNKNYTCEYNNALIFESAVDAKVN